MKELNDLVERSNEVAAFYDNSIMVENKTIIAIAGAFLELERKVNLLSQGCENDPLLHELIDWKERAQSAEVKLDAAEANLLSMDKQMAHLEQTGIYERDRRIAAEAKLDALVADNAALKQRDGLLCELVKADQNGFRFHLGELPTPATDAYLNSVRADGVKHVAESIGAKCAELKVGSKDWKELKHIVFMLGAFEEKIRGVEAK